MNARPRPMDLAVAGWSLLFLGWLLLDWGGARWAPLFDLILFAGIAAAAVTQQSKVAMRTPRSRDRLAWGLLAASAFSRLVSGGVWGLYVELSGSRATPSWLGALGLGYLVFGIAGLLTFPSATFGATDRVRARLDASIVLIGAGLLVWYFALAPMVRAEGSFSVAPGARLNTIGDAATVILASALYLRANSRATRVASAFLLGAFLLQVIPDIGFWQRGWVETYRAGDPIAGVWYAAWALKWLAARAADAALDAEPSSGAPADVPYRSGAIPHLFLIAATLLLLLKLATQDLEDRALFTLGSAVLTALLIARQSVEQRERDRLHRLLRAEEERYGALLQHAYDAVIVVDADLTMRYASPATDHLLGLAVGPEGPSLATYLHPTDADLFRAALRDPGGLPRSLDVRVREANGGWRLLSGTIQDLRGNALIGGFVYNAHDRTREERLAGGLRDAQQFEALGVLASGLAHDLNNILMVVASHVELLRDDKTLDDPARVDLEAIGLATDRARALTQGLLALSRRKRSHGRAVALDDFAREYVARRTGLRLADPGSGAAPVMARGDPDALTQVVDAALEECHDAGPADGEIVLRVRERALSSAEAEVAQLDAGMHGTVEVGALFDGVADVIEPPVRSSDTGDWDLAPGDLSMLMAVAAAREMGGALVRERRGAAARLTVILPTAAH